MSAQEQMEAFGTSASRAELKTAGFKAVGSSVMSLLGGPWASPHRRRSGAHLIY